MKNLDKLAYTLYTTNLANTHWLDKKLNGKCTCIEKLKQWNKYKSDWRGVARRYLKGKL